MKDGFTALLAISVGWIPRLDATAWAVLVCMLVIVSTGLGVVYLSHHNRGLHTELTHLQRDKNQLQMAWGQYLLEIRALAALNRVERQAHEELGMNAPYVDNIAVIERR